MSEPREYHFKLPVYQGPLLPEPPHAWYPGVQQHSPKCTSERTARSDGRVRAFVIHATAGNSSAGAMSVMEEHSASWHWLIPDENEPEHGNHVWACAPEKRAAWHVRNGRSHPDVQGGARYVNYWSLGAEIVNTQGHDPFSEWQLEQIAAIIRYAWSKYPDLVDVVSHAKLDPARRDDPGPAFPWDRFRELVLAPTPTIVAMHVPGAAAAARAATGEGTALDAAERLPAPAELLQPPVRLVGPDGQAIDVDSRRLDGVTVAEARPLVEALGYGVRYGRESGHDVMYVGLPTGIAGVAASPQLARTGRVTQAVPVLAAGDGRRPQKLDAIPDAADFRDLMFIPTLVDVPRIRRLDDYMKIGVPILDQKGEGACTGFGLATVANFLLRTRKDGPDQAVVSPRMLYEIAKRYDEWPGVQYDGSSARGAMKGWHKHGICCESEWPYEYGVVDRDLTQKRSDDATLRPLGAYFRVNHGDLVAMHAAIAEAGILFATSDVHDGWNRVDGTGRIPFDSTVKVIGGHAFAIVGYDEEGFWIQNSWGEGWGKNGFGKISYDDWLANSNDVWVGRLGAPVHLAARPGLARGVSVAAGGRGGFTHDDLRPHVVKIGNDGKVLANGTYGTTREDVERLVRDDIPRLTAEWPADRPKRILLYAHGGLVDEAAALQRIAEYRPTLMNEFVYPISFVWRTDYFTTITNVLQDARRRRIPDTTVLDAARDFLLDRMDDMLEPLARKLTGRLVWEEMKENARLASDRKEGGAARVAQLLTDLDRAERARTGKGIELHLVGHSAGSIFLAHLVPLLTGAAPDGHGLPIETVTLWAPACTVELFDKNYRPAIADGRIARFAVYTLTDEVEQADNCGGIYNKSLLYLVSNALEQHPRVPFGSGTPLVGMERSIIATPGLREFLQSGTCEWIRSPNDREPATDGEPTPRLGASTARHHGDFDDDQATVRSTLARILGRRGGENLPVPVPAFVHTRAGLRVRRQALARSL
ncbi:MAG TPA: N-acetylmuramoyl-L-alanine amidase [Gemmatimonadaceae bacterium]|nr:N-acetylmuramoyl-L-alanine amidase [Gemmatimonadaceae bacterium]